MQYILRWLDAWPCIVNDQTRSVCTEMNLSDCVSSFAFWLGAAADPEPKSLFDLQPVPGQYGQIGCLSRWYLEGKEAAKVGMVFHECPYQVGSLNWHDWFKGHSEYLYYKGHM